MIVICSWAVPEGIVKSRSADRYNCCGQAMTENRAEISDSKPGQKPTKGKKVDEGRPSIKSAWGDAWMLGQQLSAER